MLRNCFRWVRRHPRWTVLLLAVAAFLGLNVLAYNHAYAMTHFATSGAKTGRPESLSAWQKAQVCLTGINVPRPSIRSTPKDFDLPFETKTFSCGEGDLAAWYIPRSQAKGVVLLVHGYANCKSQLLPEAKAVHDRGYATFLLDCRGSGGSSGNETTVGVYEADDVAAAATQLRELNLPLVMYGRSMGSVAILRALAVHQLQPRAVVLECPFDKLLSTASNRFAAMGLPSFPFAQLVVFWGGVQHGFNGFDHNPVDYARQVRCPVLLMHGEKDPRVTQEQAESIFENLAGAKHFKVFEKAGHEPYLAVSPGEWEEAVSPFLSSHSR